jgi:hypothetical protein
MSSDAAAAAAAATRRRWRSSLGASRIGASRGVNADASATQHPKEKKRGDHKR